MTVDLWHDVSLFALFSGTFNKYNFGAFNVPLSTTVVIIIGNSDR